MPNLKAQIPEWIWGLAQDSAFSAPTMKFSKGEVALSTSSMLSPLIKVQLQ